MMTQWILFSALILSQFLGAYAFANVHGVMMVVKGDVVVLSKDGKSEKAKVGKKVFAGDTITAGVDSRAKIVMTDKNVINISPDSQFKIEKYEYDEAKGNKQVSLSVEYGKVRANVEQKYDGEKNKFHIKTPTAVAGVRGTDFLTSFDRKTRTSQVTTFTGLVAVGMPGPQGQIMNPVFVRPGEMTQSMQGAPPVPPAPVPPQEMLKMEQESMADAKQPTTQTETSNEKKDDVKKDEPKKDEPKKEEVKKDDAKASNEKKDDRQPASANDNGPKKDEPAQSRGPASSAGSMINNKDLGPDMAKDINMGPQVGRVPIFGSYQPIRPIEIPKNDFVNDTIRSGNTKTNIIIRRQE